MKRLLFVLLAWISLSSTQAFAARPLLSLLRGIGQHQTVITHSPRPVVSDYEYRRQMLNARYPRYTGAFHYSYFRDIGLPPGDIGFRGNGLYATPW